MTRDELLVLLIEECGEVIQAATKCLRFGWDRYEPDYGINSDVLSKEIGDLLGAAEGLPLNRELVVACCHNKIARAERAKAVRDCERKPPG